MVTKLGRVVTYHEELPLLKLHDSSTTWFCEVTWQIKYSIFSLTLDQWSPNMFYLQKTSGNKTRQGADLPWETPTLKSTWPFDHVINVRSFENLEKFNIFSLSQDFCPLNLVGCWVTGVDSARKQVVTDFLLKSFSTKGMVSLFSILALHNHASSTVSFNLISSL